MASMWIIALLMGCHRKDDLATCDWTSAPIAASGLTALWSDEAGGGLAAGEDQRLYRREAGVWTELDGPEHASGYRAVAGTADGGVWALTEHAALRYDGAAWTDMTPAAGLSFTDLIVRASGSVTLLSSAPLDCDDCERDWSTPSVWSWDGSTWLERAYDPFEGQLRALAETADGRLVAVGDHGALWVEDGFVLMPADTPLEADLDLLDVAPLGDGVVVSGEDGTILTGDPSAISALDTGTDLDLGRVLADADGQIWALGFDGDAEAASRLYWGDALVWSSMSLATEDRVRALASPSAGTLWLAGGSASDRVLEGGASGFSEVFSQVGLGPASDLVALDGDAVVIVGDGRFGVWRDGESTAYLDGSDAQLVAVAEGGDGELLALSSDGTVLSEVDGAIEPHTLDDDLLMRDLSASSDGDAVFVGAHVNPSTGTTRAAIFSREGGVYTELDGPSGAAVLSAALRFGADDLVVAAGEGASTVYLNDGGGWTALGDALPGKVLDLWGPDSDTLYAALDGDTGEGVWSYTGRNWEPVEEGPARASDLIGAGELLLAAGWDEHDEAGVWRYDGRDWTQELILEDAASVGAAGGTWWAADQRRLWRTSSCD